MKVHCKSSDEYEEDGEMSVFHHATRIRRRGDGGKVRKQGRASMEHPCIIIALIVVEIGSTRTEERNKPVWYKASRLHTLETIEHRNHTTAS